MYGDKTSKYELFSHCGEFFDMCAIEYPYRGTPISPLSLTFSDLRGCHCKYRASVDRLKKKSKILISWQKNMFGELSSKILLRLSGTLLFSRN